MTMQQKLDILNHSYSSRKEEDIIEVIIEDGYDVLIITISNTYVGNPTECQAIIKSILINLYCPS